MFSLEKIIMENRTNKYDLFVAIGGMPLTTERVANEYLTAAMAVGAWG